MVYLSPNGCIIAGMQSAAASEINNLTNVFLSKLSALKAKPFIEKAIATASFELQRTLSEIYDYITTMYMIQHN